MEELLKFFEEEGISLQITLDINQKPTVHALDSRGIVLGLQYADGETVIKALQNMKEKLFNNSESELKVKDKVEILNINGDKVAEGTIVNINDFREPSMKYAVDVDGYKEDVLFFGEERLVKMNI